MSNTDNKTRIPVTRGAKGPAKKTAEVALTILPVSWVGIDRGYMPPVSERKHTVSPSWLGVLIDHSNLRFTGAYIQGDPLIEQFGNPSHSSTVDDFTNESKSTTAGTRGWMQNIASLREQGWGIVFWYFGYSIYIRTDKITEIVNNIKQVTYVPVYRAVEVPEGFGRLHARHLKSSVLSTNPKLAGSVVFLDNEDGEGTNTTFIDAYYREFFDELEKSDSGLPAMRCGLYAHGKVAATFVKDRVDLFVWEPRLDNAVQNSAGNTLEAPFETIGNPDPLFIDPVEPSNPSPSHVKSDRRIQSFQVEFSKTDKWTGWPVGRQFRFYIGDMPTSGYIPNLIAVNGFDYNSSFVRDPSYPVAEPRIAATADSAATAGTFEGIVVAGSFELRTDNVTSNTPRMKIASIDGSTGRCDVIGSAQLRVEPDAPVAVAAFGGAPTRYITILNTGDLATFSRDPSGVWSTIDRMPLLFASDLRRLRAIALVAYGVEDLHLFFAGDDHQLYMSRSQSLGEWDVPAVIGAHPALHPFSSLVAASRLGRSVDVFALDSDGLLSAWSWSPTPTPATWQNVKLDVAAPNPVRSLLKATALAAVSPDPQKLFVFGVRKDCRLGYWEWTGPAGGWSAHKFPMEWSARLSPHTRLAAHSYPGFVEIVGLSDKATLRLYSLRSTGTTWTSWGPIDYINPADSAPAGAPPASPLTEYATGWKINPYGDLAITREPSGTVAYAAGFKSGESGVLRLNLSVIGSTWEHLL